MARGYVYILENKSLHGRLKIGKTTRTPEQRAKELSSTGLPTPFIVAYSVYVFDCDAAERYVHSKLDRYRISNNREFFSVPLEKAIGLLDALLDDENYDSEYYDNKEASSRPSDSIFYPGTCLISLIFLFFIFTATMCFWNSHIMPVIRYLGRNYDKILVVSCAVIMSTIVVLVMVVYLKNRDGGE